MNINKKEIYKCFLLINLFLTKKIRRKINNGRREKRFGTT